MTGFGYVITKYIDKYSSGWILQYLIQLSLVIYVTGAYAIYVMCIINKIYSHKLVADDAN